MEEEEEETDDDEMMMIMMMMVVVKNGLSFEARVLLSTTCGVLTIGNNSHNGPACMLLPQVMLMTSLLPHPSFSISDLPTTRPHHFVCFDSL